MRILCLSLLAALPLTATAQTSNLQSPLHRPAAHTTPPRRNDSTPQATETTLYTVPGGNYFGLQLTSLASPQGGNTVISGLNNSSDLSTVVNAFSQGNGYQPAALGPSLSYAYENVGVANPPVIVGKDEVLYGMASEGGANSAGYIFSVTGGVVYDLYDFDGTTLSGNATGNLILGSDGLLYATSATIGGGSGGTLFSFDLAQNHPTVLHTFCQQANCADGTEPEGIVEGHDGNIYGVAEEGENYNGTLWSYNRTTQQFTTLSQNLGGSAQVSPIAPPIEIPGHNLIGSAQSSGVIWEYNLDTQTSTFKDSSAKFFIAPFFLASDGNLYIPISQGGPSGAGFFASYTPGANDVTDLYDFEYSTSFGDQPVGNTFQDAAGNFYLATGTIDITPSALISLSVPGVTSGPLTMSVPQAYAGNPVTMTFAANNLFSNTAQQCYLFATQNSTGKLFTYGPLAGALNSSNVFTGTQTLTAPTPGTYGLTLECGGGMESIAETVTVDTPASTGISLSPSSVTSGQSGTLTVGITSSSGTVTGGTASVTCGNLNLGSEAVSNGAANFTLPNTAGLPAGTYSCTAKYSGYSSFAASSAQQSITLSNQSTGTTVSSTNDTVNPGDQITLTATIAGGNYTPNGGYVTFQTNGVTIGTAQVQSGAASLKTTVPNVQPGTYSVTGFYSGTNTGSASSSGSTNITVQ